MEGTVMVMNSKGQELHEGADVARWREATLRREPPRPCRQHQTIASGWGGYLLGSCTLVFVAERGKTPLPHKTDVVRTKNLVSSGPLSGQHLLRGIIKDRQRVLRWNEKSQSHFSRTNKGGESGRVSIKK